jgi:hypothetical protein
MTDPPRRLGQKGLIMPHRWTRVAGAATAAALTLGVLPATLAQPAAAAPVPAAAVAKKRTVNLILDYTVKATCPVYPNYPRKGVKDNAPWTIAPGDVVGWRYNVGKNPTTTYAMVSDRKYRNTSHLWWGFVKRSCIGTSIGGEHFPTPTSSYPAGRAVPTRQLSGRSAVTRSHYRKVDFTPPAATVVDPHRRVRSFGTLRDYPNRFVIGNVKKGWHVRTTNQHKAGWTKVYVPNAKRWGWVQNAHIRK